MVWALLHMVTRRGIESGMLEMWADESRLSHETSFIGHPPMNLFQPVLIIIPLSVSFILGSTGCEENEISEFRVNTRAARMAPAVSADQTGEAPLGASFNEDLIDLVVVRLEKTGSL